MSKSESNVSKLIKYFETKSQAETRTSQTKVEPINDNERRTEASGYTDNDQKKLMTESVADMDQNKSKVKPSESEDNSDKYIEIVAQENEKADAEFAPLATTGFGAEGITESSVDCVSETGNELADDIKEQANVVTAVEVISADFADSTEITNQSMETISQDTNVSNTDNH